MRALADALMGGARGPTRRGPAGVIPGGDGRESCLRESAVRRARVGSALTVASRSVRYLAISSARHSYVSASGRPGRWRAGSRSTAPPLKDHRHSPAPPHRPQLPLPLPPDAGIHPSINVYDDIQLRWGTWSQELGARLVRASASRRACLYTALLVAWNRRAGRFSTPGEGMCRLRRTPMRCA